MAAVTDSGKGHPLTVAAPPPPPLILREQRGPVAILTLNNPPLNVLTTPLLDDLRACVLELRNDPKVRALVITGAGERAFSGGANVKEMLPMSRAEATRHSAKGQAIYDLLETAPFPVIAAVRGYCIGGGCEMVQACDFIFASPDAQFGQPEINIGVIPGWGGSRRLPRIIGPVRARRWIMTGDRVGAAQALTDGFLDQVVPGPDLLHAAVGFAESLSRKSADAIAAAKYLVNWSVDSSRAAGLAEERKVWGALFETAGQREGMGAFVEKRPASFSKERTKPSSKSPHPWDAATESPGTVPRKPGRPAKTPQRREKRRAAR
jgi:enoyl-CoA hydratase